jgi:hypothetical protein
MDRQPARPTTWPLTLTIPIVVLMALAAGGGLFVGGLYRDTPSLVAQAVGQDAVTLAVALPTLAIAGFLASRGSRRARLVWLGGLVYTVYTYTGYAFAVRFNPLFLVYVALLGCSTYALIGGLVTTDMAGIKAAFTARTPVKVLSIFLGVIAALFYLLWLSDAIPATLSGNPSQALIDAGTPTNFIHVLDMAWLLPGAIIAAVSLWRGKPIGYTLAGAILAFFVLLALAILAMAAMEAQTGLQNVIPQAAIFGLIFVLSAALLAGFLRNLKA